MPGLRSLPFAATIDELLVGQAAPQEEREPGGELQIADPVDEAGALPAWIALVQEQEAGRDQQRFDRGFDAVVEVRARTRALAVDPQQRLDIRRA